MFSNIFDKGDNLALYEKVASFVSSSGMDKMLLGGVVVGFSGGADSVFLLHFLKKYLASSGTPIVAVHINHLLRGDEAMRDEEFSRSKCASMGIEFVSLRIDVKELSKSSGLGIEECARNVRYSEFNNLIQSRTDISSIAVAHNSTDNAETIIMNILRGAGSRGSAGIPPIRGNICRPLLCLSKTEIVEALRTASVDFVFDSTNDSLEYSRNYVRHEILPRLSRLSDNPEGMLLRLSRNLRLDDEFITSCALEYLSKGVPTADGLIELHEAVFVRVLLLMVGEGHSISSACINDIRKRLSSGNFSYSLPGGGRFVSESGFCRVTFEKSKELSYASYFNECKAEIPEINCFAVLSEGSIDNFSPNVYKKSIQASLSSAIIEGRLYFRPKIDGDTVYYGRITHKLKKLYNDIKIPPNLRSRIPVLCDDKGVVWVPGFGVRDDGGVSNLRVAIFSEYMDSGKTFLSGADFK